MHSREILALAERCDYEPTAILLKQVAEVHRLRHAYRLEDDLEKAREVLSAIDEIIHNLAKVINRYMALGDEESAKSFLDSWGNQKADMEWMMEKFECEYQIADC